MNHEETIQPVGPLTWKPYKVVGLSDHSRAAFLGRAAALIVDGIECVVHCRTVDDLAVVFGGLTGTPLDEERIYKATLVRSDSILVEDFIPETVAEEQIPLPLAEEQGTTEVNVDIDQVGTVPPLQVNVDEFLSDTPGTVSEPLPENTHLTNGDAIEIDKIATDEDDEL